jgi:hypothetical protein
MLCLFNRVGTRKPVFVRAVTGAKKKSNPITQGAKPANIVDVLAGAVWGQPALRGVRTDLVAGAWLPGSPPVRRRGKAEIPEKKACNNSYTGV